MRPAIKNKEVNRSSASKKVSLFSMSLMAFVFSVSAQVKAQIPNSQHPFSTLVSADLLKVQQQETAGKSKQQVELMNQKTFEMLDNYEVNSTIVDNSRALKFIKSIDKHPVVSSAAYPKYNKKQGVEIGFCFGRAKYVHFALQLADKVEPKAIKKIWAVGPMEGDGINWAFHVATITKNKEGQWIAIDNFVGSVVGVEEWFDEIKQMSTDGKIRVYVTEPDKFSVSLGAYDSIQKGLNLPVEQDWYSGYFQDLRKWLKDAKANPIRWKDVGL